jgi:hypothetical protein
MQSAAKPQSQTTDYQHAQQATQRPEVGQNRNDNEVGGLVPHITLKSIANNEAPARDVLVDRLDVNNAKATRVAGPFVVEATLAPAQSAEPSEGVLVEPGDQGVASWVKNDHLGFIVPYRKDGIRRRDLPDLIVALTTGVSGGGAITPLGSHRT